MKCKANADVEDSERKESLLSFPSDADNALEHNGVYVLVNEVSTAAFNTVIRQIWKSDLN